MGRSPVAVYLATPERSGTFQSRDPVGSQAHTLCQAYAEGSSLQMDLTWVADGAAWSQEPAGLGHREWLTATSGPSLSGCLSLSPHTHPAPHMYDSLSL